MDLVGLAAAYLDEDRGEDACDVAGQALDRAMRLNSTPIRSRALVFVNAAGRRTATPATLIAGQGEPPADTE